MIVVVYCSLLPHILSNICISLTFLWNELAILIKRNRHFFPFHKCNWILQQNWSQTICLLFGYPLAPKFWHYTTWCQSQQKMFNSFQTPKWALQPCVSLSSCQRRWAWITVQPLLPNALHYFRPGCQIGFIVLLIQYQLMEQQWLIQTVYTKDAYQWNRALEN